MVSVKRPVVSGLDYTYHVKTVLFGVRIYRLLAGYSTHREMILSKI